MCPPLKLLGCTHHQGVVLLAGDNRQGQLGHDPDILQWSGSFLEIAEQTFTRQAWAGAVQQGVRRHGPRLSTDGPDVSRSMPLCVARSQAPSWSTQRSSELRRSPPAQRSMRPSSLGLRWQRRESARGVASLIDVADSDGGLPLLHRLPPASDHVLRSL